MGGGVSVLVGTRKGGFILRSDADRGGWRVEGPHFLGSTVHHMVADPREPGTILMSARTGHLGPTVFRSTDDGQTWKEAATPPRFPKVTNEAGENIGRSVHHVFWLTPSNASEPGVWYAGISPQALFRSEDGGVNWEGVAGFNDHPKRTDWCDPDKSDWGTPDGPKMHSVLVHPADAGHLYLSMSGGGTFESTDRGADWRPLNKGVSASFLPDPDPEYGHDPHCVDIHPLMPERLYQQNHCGIYRIDRPDDQWARIGDNMPQDVGDIGFPILLHPRDPDTVWVVPMDGTDVWPRISPSGAPAIYRSTDAGESWHRQDGGLPPEQAWWTVKRQCLAHDGRDPLGLYFGTTMGEVWQSRDEGATWENAVRHLPHVYSVEVVPAADGD